jgi:hypothetical protein
MRCPACKTELGNERKDPVRSNGFYWVQLADVAGRYYKGVTIGYYEHNPLATDPHPWEIVGWDDFYSEAEIVVVSGPIEFPGGYEDGKAHH